MKREDLCKLANDLLRKKGYGTDGSKLKGSSKRQKFFERRTIITTPMGNHR